VLNKRILSDVLTLGSATAISQALTILVLPLILKYYSPQAYGYYSVIIAMAILVLPLATGRYELAVVTEESESRVRLILGALFSLSTYSTLVYVVVLVTLDWIGLLQIQGLVQVIAVGLVLWGSVHAVIAAHMLNRQGEFKLLSAIRLLAVISKLATQLLLAAMYGFGVWGLLIGLFVEQLTYILLLVWRHGLYFFRSLLVPPRGCLDVLRKHRDYPRFILGSSFLARVSQELPIIVIGRLFGMDAAGLFSLARRLLDLPSQLISEAISKVYFRIVAEKRRTGSPFIGRLDRSVVSLMLLALLVSPLIYMFGKPLMALVLEAEWVAAYGVIAMLFPMHAIRFAVIPFQKLLFLQGLQRSALYFQLLLLGTRLFAFAAGWATDSFDTLILYMMAGGIFAYLILWYIVSGKEKEVIREAHEAAGA